MEVSEVCSGEQTFAQLRTGFRPAVTIDSLTNIHSCFTDGSVGVGLNTIYFISNSTLTAEHFGGATSKITFIYIYDVTNINFIDKANMK